MTVAEPGLHGRLPDRRGVLAHHDVSKAAALDRAVELLDMVGIPKPRQRLENYPHEFSGGMRQRAVIAIAMANNPDVIIADEPTTALDVTVQAQVLDALRAAQEETGAAMVLITHDLGVIAGQADRVLVMYAGKLVEIGTIDDVFYQPRGCPTRSGCWAACRGSTGRTSGSPRSGARRRRWSTCRRAARSPRVARWPWPSATRSSRSWRPPRGPVTSPPATTPTRSSGASPADVFETEVVDTDALAHFVNEDEGQR